MLRPYPAIVLRRYEDEPEESFQGRKDQCRNAAMAAGFPGPEKFEGNIFDESTLDAEVFAHLADFPAVFAYEAEDLADTRDQLADRINAIEAAGSKLLLVHEGIDLRGGSEASEAARKAFAVWLGLPGSDGAATEEEEESEEDTAVEVKRPKGMDDAKEALVRDHYAAHGTGSPAALKKALGLTSNGTAKNWLVWVEKNPVAEVPTNEDSGTQDTE